MSYFAIIRGPLGVGKSTVSTALAASLGAVVVSIDPLVEAGWDGGSLRLFLKANEVAASVGRKALVQGTPVVFDGCFYWKSQIRDLERRLPFPHRVFTLRAPLSLCIWRDRLRNAAFGAEAARQVYQKVTRFDYGATVDATLRVPSIVRQIRSHLPAR
jgi:predicted kinase